MIRLSDLLKMSRVSPVRTAGDAEFSRIVSDSRSEVGDSLFVCMPSDNTDTHRLMNEVAGRGARAAVVHSDEGYVLAAEAGLPCWQLSSDPIAFNQDLGLICREFYSDPTLDLRVIGVTGTNGKTTVAWMLRQALRALGRDAAYIGTLGYQAGGDLEPLGNTTLFPVDLWAKLHEARQQGVTDVVMEVSSHALHQERVSGVQFDLGVFTHLSQDHLDYHGTMDAYADAKKLLFTELPSRGEKPFVAVVNADDPTGASWLAEWDVAHAELLRPDQIRSTGFVPFTLSFGMEAGTVRGTVKSVGFDHIELDVSAVAGSAELRMNVGGAFNAWNALTAFAVLQAVGVSPAEAAEALSEVTAVPGRFESISTGRGFGVIVDYAHTADALEKLLATARSLGQGRVICVFGCGGDRDRTKRPKMAEVSTRLADITYLTSDNPRTESLDQIFEDMRGGARAGAVVHEVRDRAEAILQAISDARSGDLVVIAGKGHETYQIIGRDRLPFDDRKVAREALKAQGAAR